MGDPPVKGLIRIHPAAIGWHLIAPQQATTTIKNAAPKTERWWSPQYATWIVTDNYINDVTQSLERNGYHCRAITDNNPPPVRMRTHTIHGPTWNTPQTREHQTPTQIRTDIAEPDHMPPTRCGNPDPHNAHGWAPYDRIHWCNTRSQQ